jgi:hypothetical protein
MILVNFNELVNTLKAQRCYILSLRSTSLTDEQKTILGNITRMNNELVAMLSVNVPSYDELSREAKEITMLEQMMKLEVADGSKETTERRNT